MKIEYKPIGLIHTPFKELTGMPIQPSGGADVEGTVEIFKEYQDGLKGLEGFSHIILLYHLHRSQGFNLQIVPFIDTEIRGLFATRAPRRPKPIGLSIVQLNKIKHGILYINHIDILDGTPLLDIKPYYPEFESDKKFRTGWLEKLHKTFPDKKSDDRFV